MAIMLTMLRHRGSKEGGGGGVGEEGSILIESVAHLRAALLCYLIAYIYLYNQATALD